MELTRHTVRYWCFRFRTATEPKGVSAKGAPRGLRKRFEADPYFTDWESFGITWDVAADDHVHRIVPLRFSLEQEWNTQAWANAKPMPPSAAQEFRDALVSEAKEAAETAGDG